jgi:hypothetical protein
VTQNAASEEAPEAAVAATRGGVYANHVEVVLGDRELTLDFVRVDHDERAPAREVLVARVAMTIETFHDLRDVMAKAPPLWRTHRGRVR